MPLAFPNIGISNISMRLNRAVAVSESPFTFDQQVYQHPGARWEMEVTLPPLSHAEARAMEAFIIGLKGRSGTFYFGHPLHNLTATVALTSDADARDEVLQASGDAIPAGNYFQLGDHLYILTEDFDGSGDLTIQPPLRAAAVSATALDFTLPKSTFRMSSNDIGWSTDTASIYGFTFACLEAL